jgi:two-component system, OmpR family, sensor kinase
MSLRLRLLLAVGAVAGLALLVADAATYAALRQSLYKRVDQSLDASHLAVERVVESGRGPGEGPIAVLAPGTFVEVRDGAGNVVGTPVPARDSSGRAQLPKLPDSIAGLPASTSTGANGQEARTYFTVGSVDAGGPRFRVRASALPGGEQLIVAASLHDTLDTLHKLLAIEIAVTAAALVVAAGLGWWLVRIGLAPLAVVKQTAVAIAGGELDRRVPGDTSDTEVGQVARALNMMLTRIESAFAERDATEARLRRFVADASHELRTPLAAVSAYAEMFERGASEHPDDLARLLAGIRAESGRMGQLVEDLLLLARLDEGRPLEHQPVELVGLIATAVQTATAVGPAWPVRLQADHPVEVIGDGARLRQVVDNLLANVRAHTPEGTTTEVHVTVDGADAVIRVSDNGPGLTPEQAANAFERFYRADPSRSRQSGGAGLGLSIVAAIVGAHGGSVAAWSAPNGGAAFTIRLPAFVTSAAESSETWGTAPGLPDLENQWAPE